MTPFRSRSGRIRLIGHPSLPGILIGPPDRAPRLTRHPDRADRSSIPPDRADRTSFQTIPSAALSRITSMALKDILNTEYRTRQSLSRIRAPLVTPARQTIRNDVPRSRHRGTRQRTSDGGTHSTGLPLQASSADRNQSPLPQSIFKPRADRHPAAGAGGSERAQAAAPAVPPEGRAEPGITIRGLLQP